MTLFDRNFNGSVIKSEFSSEGRWILTVIQIGVSFTILANVYGFNRTTQNITLLQELSNKILTLKNMFPSATFVVGGDFNEAPDLYVDRFPPRGRASNLNLAINDFCSSLSLLDAFRFIQPYSSGSFTWFKADLSQKSRIDLWLISGSLAPSLCSSTISPAPLTDHAGIDLVLSDEKSSKLRIPGYWKLNSSFLLQSSYCLGIRKIIDSFVARSDISSVSKWELFKFECRKFSMKFGKQYAETNTTRNANILKEINDILNKLHPNDIDKLKLLSL